MPKVEKTKAVEDLQDQCRRLLGACSECEASLREIRRLANDIAHGGVPAFPLNELLCRPVREFPFDRRARQAMLMLGVSTLGELVEKTADELLEVRKFGVETLMRVRQVLHSFNLRLKGD